VLETIHLVLDRPSDGEPNALLYLAEPVGRTKQPPVASSPVFHPDADLTAHRAALAQLESALLADGWQREEERREHVLVGVRFHRWRGEFSAPETPADHPT
jgi:hypothetical protein